MDFFTMNLKSSSTVTAAQIDKYIASKCVGSERSSGRTSKMRNTGAYYKKAEQEYGINALFLVGVSALESGWGTSNFAHKYNSLMGVGAFNNDPSATQKYGGRTVGDGIMRSAKAIVNSFFKRGQTTLNALQSRNQSKGWKPYAQQNDGTPTQHWAPSIASLMAQLSGQKNDGLASYDGGGGAVTTLDGITPLGGNIKGNAFNEIGKDFQYNSPSMVRGTPPDITEDDYPAHRFASNPFVLRIGDSQFFIPPINIKTSKTTNIEMKHMVRHKSPQMTKSGFSLQRLEITLVFASTDQINGWEVSAPGGKTYYMDGLRALLAQFYRNPMLPIRNEFINDRLNIYNVALQNIQIYSDPNIPNLLNCQLSLLECTMEPYFGLPDFMYDLMINYPLWRWYYQTMMMKKENWRKSNTFLRPVPTHMEGKVFFRVLDPNAIEQMKADVVQKTYEKDGEKAYINPDYILSRFHIGDIRKLMTEWDFGEPVVQGVSVEIQKNLTPLRMDDYEQPFFQDVGGMTKQFYIDLYCTSRDQVESLSAMVSHLEETAREYRHRFVGGFLEIHNDIVNMCGIEFAMVTNLDIMTIDGVNDNYLVRMTFAEFNVTQKDDERLNGVNNTKKEMANGLNERLSAIYKLENVETKSNRRPQIIYETAVEDMLAQLELYPDLELPTYEVANAAVKAINDYRVSRKQSKLPFDTLPRGNEEYWVEPDFYMVYPKIEDAFRAINAGELGAKMINLIVDGSYDDIANETDGVQLNEMWSALNPNFVDNSFNPWESQMKFQEAANLDIKADVARNDYVVNAFTDWKEGHQIPDQHQLVQMMFHDLVHYDARYRLTRAFPTYLIMFVDEGQWVDGKRLWNNYYTYHSIHEVSVVRDKDNPVDLAYVRLSNTYGTFNFTSKMTDPRDYARYTNATTLTGRIQQLWKAWHLDVKDVLAESRELMDHVNLKEGARIHIRLGYSSNAKNLPICFNGQIASVNDGTDIDIICQSDGVELINQLISTDQQEGTPNEAHNAFMKYLTARQSNYWFGASAGFEFMNNYESRYGIEHFGWVESEAGGGGGTINGAFWNGIITQAPKQKEEESFIKGLWDGILVDNAAWISSKITGHPNFYVYDVMKNVYRGSEQSETGVINYGHMDMTSWGGSNGWSQFFQNTWERLQVGDGEKNVNFSVYNKTLWDIGQQFAMFVPEFICAPHHHGFRSTLFFGLPHWPVKYNYRKREGTDGLLMSDYEEVYKPFQQMHTFVTGMDIIHNNIQASSEQIKHIATGLYMRGDVDTTVEGITVYADRSIMINQQKQMLVDTGVYQDLFLHDATIGLVTKYGLKPIVEGFVGLGEWAIDGIQAILKVLPSDAAEKAAKNIEDWQQKVQPTETVSQFMENLAHPGKIAAESVTIGALQRNFMEMYQGELILLGNAAVKPWDLSYINDTHTKLSGTFQVGKVTHSISRATGFTSVIKPDLVVGRVDGRGGRNYVINTATAAATGISLVTTKKLLCSKMAQSMWKSIASWEKSENKVKALGKGMLNLAGKIKPMKTILTTGAGWAKSSVDLLKATGLKGTLQNVGGKTLRLMKGNLFLAVLTGGITEMFMTWYDKETKYNNVIYIYPLWKAGEPFAAGIRGAMHIIPNYIDARYSDPTGAGAGEFYKSLSDYSAADGTGISSKGKVIHPLASKAKISSGYGWRFNGTDFHDGLDFLPPLDTKGKVTNPPVYAAADGEVIHAAYSKSAGNWVQIRHTIDGQDYVTSYMHLKSYSVSKGSRVTKGQRIGIMGKTGNVVGKDGTHLHFEVAKGKTRTSTNKIDPKQWLERMGVTLI